MVATQFLFHDRRKSSLDASECYNRLANINSSSSRTLSMGANNVPSQLFQVEYFDLKCPLKYVFSMPIDEITRSFFGILPKWKFVKKLKNNFFLSKSKEFENNQKSQIKTWRNLNSYWNWKHSKVELKTIACSRDHIELENRKFTYQQSHSTMAAMATLR